MSVLDTSIEFLKGLGPARVDILRKELNIFTVEQLLAYYPFRYEDRSKVFTIPELTPEMENTPVQVKGTITYSEIIGTGPQARLVAYLKDGLNNLELIWFASPKYFQSRLLMHTHLLVYGRLGMFNGRYSIVHPEVEQYDAAKIEARGLQAIYNTTEMMKKRHFDSKVLSNVIIAALDAYARQILDPLPPDLISSYAFLSKADAVRYIHAPPDYAALEAAKHRLKFEELFALQLRLVGNKAVHDATSKGVALPATNALVEKFKAEVFPYKFTNAQDRVLAEIAANTASGMQMNRLLQGDVGSGKTAVAFCALLLAVGAGYQAAIMAPTEILAEQHFADFTGWCEALGIKVAKLTGSVPAKVRKTLLPALEACEIDLLVGTHALIEDTVVFAKLALCVIDEQHRFGVEQRARLLRKGLAHLPAHALIMTATPIPRTLALTQYGDLDTSKIDELPAGRKPITTVHRYETDRVKIYEFIRSEVEKGRQAYIVYPLIEESEKLALKNLMDGLEQVRRNFPQLTIAAVHGRMKWAEREPEMHAFAQNKAQLMVATTVIEVGVNVPNATIMLVESAERFGLSQLHQLRGRVGRAGYQSYCILLTKTALSQDSRTRIKTIVSTTDGFKIAEVDLELRGHGDVMGTQQSGQVQLRIADLSQDSQILTQARAAAEHLVSASNRINKAYKQEGWYALLTKLYAGAKDYTKVG